MSGQSWTELGIAAAALLLMTVAATIAATSALAGQVRLRRLAEEQGRHRSLERLLDPHRSLVAALLLVEAASIATAASMLTALFAREVGRFPHLLAVVVTTLVYLALGLALPRALSRRRPNRTAAGLLAIGLGLEWLTRPLVGLVDAITRGLARLVPAEPVPLAAVGTEEEIRSVLAHLPEDGVVQEDEARMIDNVLQLEDTTARDIMVPRVDIVAVAEDADPAEVVATITAAGHSRVPVYRDSIDQIVGVLYAKDLLPWVTQDASDLPLADLVRKPVIIPETKRIDDLLREFQLSRNHLAIVVDEYGGTAGVVTFEDIIEEIVGDIRDEYDTEEAMPIQKLAEGRYVADAAIAIGDLEMHLGKKLPEDGDFESLGGLIVHRAGRVPEVGATIALDGYRLIVREADETRVVKVEIVRAEPDLAPPAEASAS